MIRIHQKKEIILLDLKSYIPNVEFIYYCDMCQLQALKIFDGNEKDLNQIKLHLKGIDF